MHLVVSIAVHVRPVCTSQKVREAQTGVVLTGLVGSVRLRSESNPVKTGKGAVKECRVYLRQWPAMGLSAPHPRPSAKNAMGGDDTAPTGAARLRGRRQAVARFFCQTH